MAQCVVYARVSTKQQAWGHGLVRQIEYCQEEAKRRSVYVRSVYVDVCSGSAHKPNRERAILEAKRDRLPIFVEAMDRWTRDAEDSTLTDTGLDIVVCAPWQKELSSLIARMLK